jgi:hypothetical protein
MSIQKGKWPNFPVTSRGRVGEIRSWKDVVQLQHGAWRNLYLFVENRPVDLIDPKGLDATNNSDLSAWVFISGSGPGTGWSSIAPGATITGDVDGVCPNVAGAVVGPGGTYSCLKIIDCYDATISGTTPGPYSITPVYAGAFAGRGNTFKRKCCCAIPRCAGIEQGSRGGAKDPVAEWGSKPPDFP